MNGTWGYRYGVFGQSKVKGSCREYKAGKCPGMATWQGDPNHGCSSQSDPVFAMSCFDMTNEMQPKEFNGNTLLVE